MAFDVEGAPGAWVSEQAARKSRYVWLLCGLLIAIALLAVGLLVSSRATVASSILVIVLAVGVWRYANRKMDDAVHWLGGARAEEAVGEELNKLRPEFVVMHDLDEVGPGNVDHLVAGPTGVFMVETKRSRYEDGDLAKARGRAAAVHDQLGVWVTPVICLATREREPFKHDRVWIVPRTRINTWIRAQRNQRPDPDRLTRQADGLCS
ncbi:MAG: nuclease-related domain-containing protein [Gaiellaceae bacterium]